MLNTTKHGGIIQFAFNDVPANASGKGAGACGIIEDPEYYQEQRVNLGKRVGRRWKFPVRASPSAIWFVRVLFEACCPLHP